MYLEQEAEGHEAIDELTLPASWSRCKEGIVFAPEWLSRKERAANAIPLESGLDENGHAIIAGYNLGPPPWRNLAPLKELGLSELTLCQVGYFLSAFPEWHVPPLGEFALTDVGNAERLVAYEGNNLKYVPGLG